MKFIIAALALVAAPALAHSDVVDAAAPEATPVVNGRMFEFLDESARVMHARSVANVEAEEESSNMALIAVPCVAAAVGVAGFAAYKKRNVAVESSMTLSA